MIHQQSSSSSFSSCVWVDPQRLLHSHPLPLSHAFSSFSSSFDVHPSHLRFLPLGHHVSPQLDLIFPHFLYSFSSSSSFCFESHSLLLILLLPLCLQQSHQLSLYSSSSSFSS